MKKKTGKLHRLAGTENEHVFILSGNWRNCAESPGLQCWAWIEEYGRILRGTAEGCMDWSTATRPLCSPMQETTESIIGVREKGRLLENKWSNLGLFSSLLKL